jgi:hypothetical protein
VVKQSQSKAAAHCTSALACPAPNDRTVKSVTIVSGDVLLKSHSYSSNAGPVGTALPAWQLAKSVAPQRHGSSSCPAAQFDAKMVPSVWKQIALSVAKMLPSTLSQVLPSGRKPLKK